MKTTHTTTQRVFSSKNAAGNNILTARKPYVLPSAANILSTSSPDVSFMPAIDANIYTITQRVLSSKNASTTHNTQISFSKMGSDYNE